MLLPEIKIFLGLLLSYFAGCATVAVIWIHRRDLLPLYVDAETVEIDGPDTTEVLPENK